MNDYLQICSVKDYFEAYGREAIYNQKADPKMVRQQLIDAFHKEIFGLVAMRAKKRFDDIPMEGDPEALRIAANVIRDETRKWKKLVDMFEAYRETSGVIKYDDISMVPEEGNGEVGFKDGELVTRDILDDTPVEAPEEEEEALEPDPYAAVEYYEREEMVSSVDFDGDDVLVVKAPEVTDGPFTSGYMEVVDEATTHEEHDF